MLVLKIQNDQLLHVLGDSIEQNLYTVLTLYLTLLSQFKEKHGVSYMILIPTR